MRERERERERKRERDRVCVRERESARERERDRKRHSNPPSTRTRSAKGIANNNVHVWSGVIIQNVYGLALRVCGLRSRVQSLWCRVSGIGL